MIARNVPRHDLLRSAQDGEARPHRERRIREEQRDRGGPEAIGRVAGLLTARGDHVHEPEAGDGEEPLRHRRRAGDVGSELWAGQHERERRQPDPRPEEGHAGRPDERGGDEQEGDDRRARAEHRRRGEDGDEAEGRHELRLVTDGDGGGRDGCHECAQEAVFDRDQLIEAGRGEQRQGNGRKADGHEDVPERAAQPRERELTEHEEAGADDEPDEDAQRLGDPAAAEGEAQEEDAPRSRATPPTTASSRPSSHASSPARDQPSPATGGVKPSSWRRRSASPGPGRGPGLGATQVAGP
jgi:hypothetical protein